MPQSSRKARYFNCEFAFSFANNRHTTAARTFVVRMSYLTGGQTAPKRSTVLMARASHPIKPSNTSAFASGVAGKADCAARLAVRSRGRVRVWLARGGSEAAGHVLSMQDTSGKELLCTEFVVDER